MWLHNENANGVPVPAIRFNFSSFDTASGTLAHLSFPATCRSSKTSRLTGAIWTFVRRKVIEWMNYENRGVKAERRETLESASNWAWISHSGFNFVPFESFSKCTALPVTVLNLGICIYSIVSRSTGKHTLHNGPVVLLMAFCNLSFLSRFKACDPHCLLS